MSTTLNFRERFREENISKSYSGKLHFVFITLWCLAGIIVCVLNIYQPTLKQLLIIPITFLYTNLFEYIGHRFPMHHRYNALKPVFKRHTLQHHHFFTDEHMNCDTVNDFKIILFPPVLLIFFSLFFVLHDAYSATERKRMTCFFMAVFSMFAAGASAIFSIAGFAFSILGIGVTAVGV